VRKSLATAADGVKGALPSVCQDTSVTAADEAVADEQGPVGVSHSGTVAAVGSSDTGGNVEQLLVDSADVVDVSSSLTISSLDNGTLYVLQPVESVEQSIGCRTLRLLRAANDEDDATPTVLVAAPAAAADMIPSSADLAHFLSSAGITASVKAEPVSHAESTS